MRRRVVLLAVVAAVLSGAAPALAARPLAMGFFDGAFGSERPGADQRLALASQLGASIVRIDVGWPAARRPADPTNPGDPAYDFTNADAAVRAATARGLGVLLSFTGAPSWAQTPNAPAGVDPSTWKPNAQAIGAYGAALARRYDGRFADAAGHVLPRVRYFQVWNEPNLPKYLMPQWSGGREVGAVIYRGMLNAFYVGVKSAQPGALVVTAGTAPFGDFGHTGRTMPVTFWRTLLAARANFDVLAHHPYSVGGPSRHALNAGDVSIPDMGKLTRLLSIARKRGTIHGSKRVWVTEVAYDSRPPDPDGVPIATQARWLEQTMEILWRQGVSAVFWFQVIDQPPYPSYSQSSQGGVYYLNGAPKPSVRAYRFPFVAERSRAWARAPSAGTLRIQRRSGSHWRTVARTRVRAGQVVDLPLRSARHTLLRAVLGHSTSLSWRVS